MHRLKIMSYFGSHITVVFTKLLRHKTGSSAVEFALVAPLFVIIILFIMAIGASLFINQALDSATSQAARLILTGTAQTSSMTSARFKQKICNNIIVRINCNDIILNLYKVSPASSNGYFSFVKSDLSGLVLPRLAPGSGQFDLGMQGEYQYLIVIYPITTMPPFVKNLFNETKYNGLPAYLAISTAAFKNEKF